MPQYSFFTGLPRSGSTVFACLLKQNPDIYVGVNSWLCHTLWTLNSTITENVSYQAQPDPVALNKFLTSLYTIKYESKQDKKIIFDKGFTWGTPPNYNLIVSTLGIKPKFIVCNRDINEVADSLIKIIVKNPGCVFQGSIKLTDSYDIKKKTLMDGFLKPIIMSTNNLLYNHKEDIYVINFNDLMSNPNKVVKGFYDFFELPKFKHNLYKIENMDKENDMVYGIPGMHDVRPLLTKKKLARKK
jgi:sulfotransferase